MRKIIAIAWNDLRIEFSGRSSLIFFLILPILFTWIIGLAMKDMVAPAQNNDPRTPLVVVNQDQCSASVELLSFMDTSDIIRIVEQDSATAEALFQGQNIAAVLWIPTTFSSSIMENGQADLELELNPMYSSSARIQQAVREAIEPVNRSAAIARQYVEANPDLPDKQAAFSTVYREALESFKEPYLTTSIAYRPNAQTPQRYTSSFQLTSPGQLVTWVLVTLAGTSVLFVNERKYGTLRRLLISPTHKGTLLAGKILGRVLMGILQMTLLILFGKYVLQVNWGNSPIALMLMVVSFSFTGTALGILLGTFAKTGSQASGLSTLFSMVLASLGGAWWPLEITPRLYQQLVQVLPTTWAMTGFNRIIIGGQGIQGVLLPCGILWVFSLVFFMISIRKLSFE